MQLNLRQRAIWLVPQSIDKLSFLQIFEIEQQSQLIGSIPQTIYNIPNSTRFSLMKIYAI